MASSSLTISFGVSQEIDNFKLKVVNFCTDAVIPEAAFTITGGGYSATGITDSNGYYTLGKLKPGVYTIKVTKAGFAPTDTDRLANDAFTVQASS